jgi:hypothetical protein
MTAPSGTLAAAKARMSGYRALLIAAGLAGVMSLGLPWASGGDSTYLPGWYVPGTCVTVYDPDGWASTDCSTGIITPGILLPGHGAYGGKSTAARVFVVLVAVLVAFALRRGSSALARTALLVAGLGLVLGGLRPRTGQLVYAGGMLLLAVALGRAGLLTLGRRPVGQDPPRRPVRQDPPAGTTSPIT